MKTIRLAVYVYHTTTAIYYRRWQECISRL